MKDESLEQFKEITKLINTNVEKAQEYAINLSDKAIEKYPEDKDLYIYLQALANINLAKPLEALDLYKKINFFSKAFSTFGEAFLNNGIANFARVFYDSGNFAESFKIISLIENYLNKTDDIFALHTAVRIYFENDEFEKMKKVCERVTALNINISPDGWHISKKVARRLFSSLVFEIFYYFYKEDLDNAKSYLKEILNKLELNGNDKESIQNLKGLLISKLKPELTNKESFYLSKIMSLEL